MYLADLEAQLDDTLQQAQQINERYKQLQISYNNLHQENVRLKQELENVRQNRNFKENSSGVSEIPTGDNPKDN